MKTKVRLSNLKLINALYPSVDALEEADVSIETVAHSLAQINRYTGSCPYPYSVAQHSVLCSHLAQPGHKMEALLHDAHESLVGDTSAPVKRTMRFMSKFTTGSEWDQLEGAWEHATRLHFCIPTDQTDEVSRVDKLAASMEKHALFDGYYPSQPILHSLLEEMDWKNARHMMIERYHALRNEE